MLHTETGMADKWVTVVVSIRSLAVNNMNTNNSRIIITITYLTINTERLGSCT